MPGPALVEKKLGIEREVSGSSSTQLSYAELLTFHIWLLFLGRFRYELDNEFLAWRCKLVQVKTHALEEGRVQVIH